MLGPPLYIDSRLKEIDCHGPVNNKHGAICWSFSY